MHLPGSAVVKWKISSPVRFLWLHKLWITFRAWSEKVHVHHKLCIQFVFCTHENKKSSASLVIAWAFEEKLQNIQGVLHSQGNKTIGLGLFACKHLPRKQNGNRNTLMDHSWMATTPMPVTVIDWVYFANNQILAMTNSLIFELIWHKMYDLPPVYRIMTSVLRCDYFDNCKIDLQVQ